MSLSKIEEKKEELEKLEDQLLQIKKQLIILIPSFSSTDQTPPNEECKSEENGKSQ